MGIADESEIKNQPHSRSVIALAPNQPQYRILVVDDSEIDDSYKKLIVHFDCEEDIRDFEALIKQKITDKTKYIHFPFKEKDAVKDFIVTSE